MNESVFDADLFAQNLQSNYGGGNSVGFAASINAGGVLNAKTATAGFARTGNESLLGFDTDSRITIASVAKTITATAILKILQDQQMSLDESIASHLPNDWSLGPNVSGITFRDVLTHRSGFRLADSDGDGRDDTGLAGQTFYAPLKQAVAIGIDGTDADGNGLIDVKEQFDYENANFALMRVALGYLWNGVQDSHIDNGNALAMPSFVSDQVLSDWGTYFVGPDRLTASIYKSYVKNFVLEPMGIQNADTRPSGPSSERALHYPLGTTPTSNTDGFSYGDRTLFSGGEGWYLSAAELSRFFHFITNTNVVLREPMRDLMQSEFLGLMNPDDWSWVVPELFDEPFLTHGGDLNNARGEVNSAFAAFPNNVQAGLLINSAVSPGRSHQVDELIDAWENAWTEITIGGRAGDDVFDVRLSGDRRTILVDLNGQRVASLNAFVVTKLTLKGYRGHDQFNIESLPNSVELVAMGNLGDDRLDLSNGDWNTEVQGDVTFDGGPGNDSLVIDDRMSPAATASYSLQFRTVTRSGIAGDVAHFSVENLTLNAGNSENDIRVASPAGDTAISVNAGRGDDTILIENSFLASDLTVDGEAGDDTITLRNSTVIGTVALGGGRGLDSIEAEDSSLRGILALSGDEHADSIVTRDLSLSAAGRLWVYGDSGDDTLRALGTFGQAGSRMTLNGGSSGDTLIVNDATGALAISLRGDAGRDSLEVFESNVSSTINLFAGSGNDFIRLGGGDISTRLDGSFFVAGEDGEDHLVLEDRAGTGSHDFYVFNDGFFAGGGSRYQTFTKSGFAGQIWHDDTETITLKATHQDSTTNIRTLYANTTLNVNVVDGNDDIRIHGSDRQSTINVKGGNGSDVVSVSPDDRNLDLVAGVLSFDGQNGTGDQLHLLDDNSIGESRLQIGAATFQKNQSRQWTHFGLERLTLQANDEPNTLFLDGVSLANEVIVDLNGGDDTAHLTSTSRDLDSAIRGDLAIRAGDSGPLGDSIILHDQSDNTGNDSYTINNTFFSKNTTERWTLAGFEKQTLYASQFNNTVNIQRFGSFSTDNSLRVFGNGGDDDFVVGAVFNRTTFINDDIQFTGGTGADVLRINDAAGTSNRTYTLNTGVIDMGTVFGTLTHSGVENIRIDAGQRRDTFNVETNAQTVALHFDGNAGSDLFRVAEPSQELADVAGEVRILGGGPLPGQTDVDELQVFDASAIGPETYSISANTIVSNQISKSAGDFVQYAGLQKVSLQTGRGHNTINIPHITEGHDLIVKAGPGSDEFNVGAIGTLFAVTGSITVDGEAGGNDRLNVLDDDANAGPYTVTASSVSRDDILPIHYANLRRVSLNVDIGNNTVTVESTNPGTRTDINTGADADSITIASASSPVHVDAGSNGRVGDHVAYLGTSGFDSFRLQGEQIRLRQGSVLTTNTERRTISAQAGADLVRVVGVNGSDESFHVQPSGSDFRLSTGHWSDVVLSSVVRLRVIGNNPDMDTLQLSGTSGADHFDVSMGAAGSRIDPFLRFNSSFGTGLTLDNYSRVGAPRLLGLGGHDVFDVLVTNGGPAAGRDIMIDGGNPTGSSSGDTLNVFYPSSQASVKHAPQDADTGSIDLVFSPRRFRIDYDDLEDVLFHPI